MFTKNTENVRDECQKKKRQRERERERESPDQGQDTEHYLENLTTCGARKSPKRPRILRKRAHRDIIIPDTSNSEKNVLL